MNVLKAKNLDCILLIVISMIVLSMAVIPIAVAQQYSDEGMLYRELILPCVMDNAVKMGMPSSVIPDAVCVVLAGAENIAAGTDMIVDVVDLRAAMVAYNYNFGLLGDNLTVVCNIQLGLELGTLPSFPGKPPMVNCLEGTGIAPVDCASFVGWICVHAGTIDDAMESACASCDVTWKPERPISGAPECLLPILSVVPFDSPEPDQTFTVNVTITNVLTSVILLDFEFKLWYNSTLINATEVVLGPALEANYTETVEDITLPGLVRYGCNLTTPPPLNISDTETLATINFIALELGTSFLRLNETVIHITSDTAPVEQEHMRQGADITVISEFPAVLLMPTLVIATVVAAFLGKKGWSRKRRGQLLNARAWNEA